MNEDDRLNQYFHLRATTITIEPGDSASIVARAGRRRRSRRTFGVVAAAAVVLVGALAVFGGGTTTRELNAAGSPDARAALEWTKVDVPNGLGWGAGTVSASDGSIYGLSTAPGPVDPANQGPPSRSALYHSTDGQTWDELSLPGDLSASGLATSGGHLYAVGTAPGGGGVDLVVASSADGAGTWSEARLPSPAATLAASHPTEVRLSRPVITSGPDGVVAAVTVTTIPDVAARLGLDQQALNAGWETTVDGVNLFAPQPPGAGCGGLADPSGATTSTLSPDEAAARTEKGASCAAPTIARSYTWTELGLEPELQAILGGSTHLYRSTDGKSFDEVTPSGIPAGSVAALIGAGDGYRLLVGDTQSSNLHPLWSADGRAWSPAGSDILGWVQSVGLLAGTPAAVIGTEHGVTLLTSSGAGGWSSSDLLQATGISASSDKPVGLIDAAIGPLGLAAVATDGDQNGTVVVDSPNGHDFTRHRLTDLAGPGDWSVAGVVMNADAVVVRLLPVASSSTATAPGPQRLLVGTPG